MNTNLRHVLDQIRKRSIPTAGIVTAALITAIVFFGVPSTARAQGVDPDRESIRIAIDNVFEGWRTLNLGLYMSVWDENAVQYLKNGISRNYSQIQANRAEAFAKYYRVDATWTADSIEVYGNKATVVVRYSMTFYRKDGKVITENEKEFYVLKRYPDGMWTIVENYDYLPR